MKNSLLTTTAGMFSMVNGAFGQFAGGAGDGFDQNIAVAISLNETIGSTPAIVPTLTEWGVIVLIVGLGIAAYVRVKKMNNLAQRTRS